MLICQPCVRTTPSAIPPDTEVKTMPGICQGCGYDGLVFDVPQVAVAPVQVPLDAPPVASPATQASLVIQGRMEFALDVHQRISEIMEECRALDASYEHLGPILETADHVRHAAELVVGRHTVQLLRLE